MDELVKRLSEKEHVIRVNRIEKSIEALQKLIDLNFIHILFEETGTEISIKLDPERCDSDEANLKRKDTFGRSAYFEL